MSSTRSIRPLPHQCKCLKYLRFFFERRTHATDHGLCKLAYVHEWNIIINLTWKMTLSSLIMAYGFERNIVTKALMDMLGWEPRWSKQEEGTYIIKADTLIELYRNRSWGDWLTYNMVITLIALGKHRGHLKFLDVQKTFGSCCSSYNNWWTTNRIHIILLHHFNILNMVNNERKYWTRYYGYS